MLALMLSLAVAGPIDPEAALSDARRAYAHDEKSAAVRAELKSAFLEARHALIDRTRDFERVIITCPSLRGSISTESCVRDHVEHIAYASAFVEMQGDELVTALVLPGYEELFLTEGVVRGVRPEGDNVQVDLDVIRARGPRDPAVERVLFAGFPQHHAPVPQFTGPVLSRASRQALASLPPSFTVLSGVPSRRYVQEICGKPTPRIAFAQSLLGQGAFSEGDAVVAITAAHHTADGVRVELKKGKPVELRWPSPEPDVALRGDAAWAAAPAKFPVHPAKNCPR